MLAPSLSYIDEWKVFVLFCGFFGSWAGMATGIGHPYILIIKKATPHEHRPLTAEKDQNSVPKMPQRRST